MLRLIHPVFAHKLKYKHIHLTSFSKMRVELAVQVCVCVRACVSVCIINYPLFNPEKDDSSTTLTTSVIVSTLDFL